MKTAQIILFVVLFILMILGASCSSRHEESKRTVLSDTQSEYKIIVIEGCEYIIYSYSYANNYSFSITHKGNCKNH